MGSTFSSPQIWFRRNGILYIVNGILFARVRPGYTISKLKNLHSEVFSEVN